MEDRKEKKKKKEEHNSNIRNQLVSKLLWLFMQILFMRIVIVLPSPNAKPVLQLGLGLFERGRGAKSSLDAVETHNLGRPLT